MGLSAGAHHRRRSSMLTGTGRASQPISTERRDDTLWSHGDGGNHKREEQEPLTAGDDTDASDVVSAAETLELDPISSDDDQYDEETGLTSHQKRQRRRRRKQRRKLDARIADVKGQGSIREILSDRNVVKKLLINGGLILLWYFFSLSISIYNKWMFSENDIVFPFPLFTTSLHMAVQFSLSVIILWIFPSLRPRQPTGSAATSPIDGPEEPQPIMTKLFYFTRLVPCGAATSLDVGLDYRRVAHQDSSIISPAPGGYLNEDYQSSSAGDQRRSFRVLSSGARRGLSISTSIILEDDGPPSPLKSAPATITTMAEAGFPHLHAPDREASPGVHSTSSVSPVRSQNFTQH